MVVLSRTSILCDVITTGGKPTLLCEYVDGKGVVHPNSYAFAISDELVSSLRWDASKTGARSSELVRGLIASPDSTGDIVQTGTRTDVE